MPTTSRCCCDDEGCTPCEPFTVTVRDSATLAPIKRALVGVRCDGVAIGGGRTNAAGQVTLQVCECHGEGEITVCRWCYLPQAIPYDACPEDMTVDLVRGATQSTYWLTNDTPYNYIWDGSAWVPDPSIPIITIPVTYGDYTDPDWGTEYSMWAGCGPITMNTILHRETYGGGCERAGLEDRSVNINIVIGCAISDSDLVAVSFQWISSVFTPGPFPQPAEWTDCFNWEAGTVINEYYQPTSIYGITVPPACGATLGGTGAYIPVGCNAIADGTIFRVTGLPGQYWVIRTTDPGAP